MPSKQFVNVPFAVERCLGPVKFVRTHLLSPCWKGIVALTLILIASSGNRISTFIGQGAGEEESITGGESTGEEPAAPLEESQEGACKGTRMTVGGCASTNEGARFIHPDLVYIISRYRLNLNKLTWLV